MAELSIYTSEKDKSEITGTNEMAKDEFSDIDTLVRKLDVILQDPRKLFVVVYVRYEDGSNMSVEFEKSAPVGDGLYLNLGHIHVDFAGTQEHADAILLGTILFNLFGLTAQTPKNSPVMSGTIN